MSLKTIFLVYMNFDIFQNIGIIEKGFGCLTCVIFRLYQFRVSLLSKLPNRILLCDSSPAVKHAISNNKIVIFCTFTYFQIEGSEYSYEPCYIDSDNNTFISRKFSISQEYEVISLRDSVCWRVENFEASLGSVEFSFKVELVALSGALSIKPEGGGPEKGGRVIGTQRILFHDIGAESVFRSTDLIFHDIGVCEIRGVSACTLVDIRYDHMLEEKQIPQTFESYIFENVTVSVFDANEA